MKSMQQKIDEDEVFVVSLSFVSVNTMFLVSLSSACVKMRCFVFKFCWCFSLSN
jgi:hypothetical protein